MKKRILALCMALAMVFVCSITVFAADEGENNDNKGSATQITPGEEVHGKLSSRKDQDWYKITVSENGFLVVNMNHEMVDSSSAYWKLAVYQADGVTAVNGDKGEWGIKGNKNGATSQIGVCPGTYYIKVAYYPYNYSGNEYTLWVDFTASDFTEQEPNGSAKTATAMALNTPYSGAVSSNKDHDWYRFELPEDGYVNISFTHELVDSSSSYWDLEVVQADGVTGVDELESIWDIPGNKNGGTSQLGLPAGTYLIRIGYHPYNHSDLPYELTVNFTASNETELEPNGSAKKATNIALNTDYSGAIFHQKDTDWYRIELEEDGYVQVELRHDMIDSSSEYWDLSLLKEDGVNCVLDYDGYWDFAGNEVGKTSQVGLRAGTYYLKLSYHPYNHCDWTYQIRVNYTATRNTELEPNSSASGATEIVPNADYYGAIAGQKDVDWYKITVTSGAKTTLNFYHEPVEDTSNLWDVVLYESDTVTKVKEDCVGGASDKSIDLGELAPNTYYIKISYHPYNHSDATYKINVSEKHDCVAKWVVSQEPTCTQSGMRAQVCQTCGKPMGSEAVPALGHISENWNVVKEATCTENGFRTANCDRCHQDVEETTDILPHIYGEFQIISGSKMVPPIVKERTCQQCRHVDKVSDWSYVWIPIVTVLAAVGVVIGVINYAKAFKKGY